MDSTEVSPHIVLVPLTHLVQMHRQQVWHGGWPDRSPSLLVLPCPEPQLVAGAIDGVHAESQALQQA